MVLDAAAFDDSPTSDFDPYNSGDRSPQPSNDVRVDLSKASRPFPILGPLTGFNNKHLLKMTSDIVREAPRIIQRPLTQDEVDVVVESVSKYAQVHSWIYANGLIVGGFRAQATKADMRFPMAKYIKNMSINFERFGPLTGPMSRAAWNAVRTTAWLAWWGLPAYIIGGVVGQVAMAQKQMTDQRLKQFHNDMRSDGARKRLGDAVQKRQQGLPQSPMQTSRQMQKDGDDMSPQLASETKLERSEEMRRRGAEDFMRSSPKEPSLQSSTGVIQPKPGSQPRDDTVTFSAPEQPSNAYGGSAWDRVRNQGGQRESSWDKVRRQSGSVDQPSTSSQWQARNDVPLTDSFTFDEREEDRQLAKTEAQKEFNARIERERQGKDFNDGRSGGRKW